MNALQIGARVRARRLELGMSVETLAAKSGLNRTTLWRLENEQMRRPPRVPTIHALAKALDMAPIDLVDPAVAA